MNQIPPPIEGKVFLDLVFLFGYGALSSVRNLGRDPRFSWGKVQGEASLVRALVEPP